MSFVPLAWLASLLAGGVAALLGAMAWRLLRRLAGRPCRPDPAPAELPRWCRASWPLWRALCERCDRRLTWQSRHRLRIGLLRAGMSAAVPHALPVAFMVVMSAGAGALALTLLVLPAGTVDPRAAGGQGGDPAAERAGGSVSTARADGTDAAAPAGGPEAGPAASANGVGPGRVFAMTAVAMLAAGSWPLLWLRRRAATLRRHADQDLPFLLDLMVLCVEAGQSVNGALSMMHEHAPPGVLRHALAAALADMRAGMPRQQALTHLAARLAAPGVGAWVATLIQAEQSGASLGPVLRGLAAQQRADVFQRAEEAAMQAPVKMLLPLVLCIFPCTFIVLAFPILRQLAPLFR
ncbi:type II secretion system F family protein [Bordetella genomosp. 1]|nr:type II secretion system F family protein [Bordetella genomosp. 1]